MERQAQFLKLTFPELFEKFLLDNNIYSQFCSNILIEYSMLLYEYCEYVYPAHYISDAFTWSNTEEGYYFWKNRYKEWHKIYEENTMK